MIQVYLHICMFNVDLKQGKTDCRVRCKSVIRMRNDGINRMQLSARCYIPLSSAFQTTELHNRITLMLKAKRGDDDSTYIECKLKQLSLWHVLSGSPSRSDRILLFSAHFYCKLCATRNTKAESSRGNKAAAG